MCHSGLCRCGALNVHLQKHTDLPGATVIHISHVTPLLNTAIFQSSSPITNHSASRQANTWNLPFLLSLLRWQQSVALVCSADMQEEKLPTKKKHTHILFGTLQELYPPQQEIVLSNKAAIKESWRPFRPTLYLFSKDFPSSNTLL